MNHKKLIAVTIALTVCAFAGSNVTAHGGGGGGGHGGGFGGGGGFRGGGFNGGFRGGGFHGAFNGGGFRGGRLSMMVAFAAVGSTIAASTIGSPFVILGTRSFTIPIHTTGTIPIAIILAILMVTDTVALPMVVFVAAAVRRRVSRWLSRPPVMRTIRTRRVIREYKRAHGLPGWQDRLTTAKRTDGSTSPRRGSR